MYVREGNVSLYPEQGADAPSLPLATLLRSTLLKESTGLQSTLDQATPGSSDSLNFDVFAPEQYVESWLQSPVFLDRLQSTAAPDVLSVVTTDTKAQYIKVDGSALLVLVLVRSCGRGCFVSLFTWPVRLPRTAQLLVSV